MRVSSFPVEPILFENVDYSWFMEWQAGRVQARVDDDVDDCVVVVSFKDPVYTAPAVHDSDVSLTVSMRGGGDSWHGPGQVCVVPIIKLAEPISGRAYTRLLTEPIRQVCRDHGVTPDPHGDLPGVSVDGKKIAQVGVCFTSNVTSFGAAFNVDCDLDQFSAIDLCGIPGCPVTNLSTASGSHVTVSDITASLSRYAVDMLSNPS